MLGIRHKSGTGGGLKEEHLPLAHISGHLVPLSGTVWEALGCGAWSEEVCHWDWAVRF